MKQGSGSSRTGDQKREPISHAKDPGGAAQIGVIVVKNPTPLDAGRGYRSPSPAADDRHPCGSQGKH
jgi:hypothetical protein